MQRLALILVKSIPTCREYKIELACSVIELKDVFPPKIEFSAAPGWRAAAGQSRGSGPREST